MVCQATSDQQRRGYGFEESPQEHGRAAKRYGASRVLQQALNQLIHSTSHSRYLQQKQCIIFFNFGWNGIRKFVVEDANRLLKQTELQWNYYSNSKSYSWV